MFSDGRVPRLAAHQFLSAHEENVRVLVINMSFLRLGTPRGFRSVPRVASRRRRVCVAPRHIALRRVRVSSLGQ